MKMRDNSNSISQFAFDHTKDGEAAFVYPNVLDAVAWCTEHAIAVLGVELFVGPLDGFFTDALSSYGFVAAGITWSQFVEDNNRSAVQFVNDHRTGENQFYVLTTSSQEELPSLTAS
jgi:hypothetical protein